MAIKADDSRKFKSALDKQNKLERAKSGPGKKQRDAAEGEAAHGGTALLEKHSKGRPKSTEATQKATTKKSPQSARSQSR